MERVELLTGVVRKRRIGDLRDTDVRELLVAWPVAAGGRPAMVPPMPSRWTAPRAVKR